MPPVGFAVLGLGTLAQSAILPAFRGMQRARLVALVSRDGEKARRLATLHGVPSAYDSLEECLANPQVEAVYIATPPGTHLREVETVASAKRHVLAGKPLGRTGCGGAARVWMSAFIVCTQRAGWREKSLRASRPFSGPTTRRCSATWKRALLSPCAFPADWWPRQAPVTAPPPAP